MQLLNHGFLRLEKVAGDDLLICNAARISFAQKSTALTPREIGLIRFLMKNRHGTPFEMVEFWFHIKCPIAVAREWQRHRMASYNELSSRYKELPMEFYIPELEQCRSQVGKPGAYTFEPLSEQKAKICQFEIGRIMSECAKSYKTLLDSGLAKEVARNVLPLGIYTEFLFKSNLRSIMNFISLRADPTALYEIRVYAQAMAKVVASIVPETWQAFEDSGRIVP